MDFGALPPEINSARIYAGPGSAPLMRAAAAWERLASELNATADSYASVISGLTGDGWRGASALSMAAAAAPYVAWMRGTAAQAEQAAAQAVAAASAYESAYAMTVPPGVIAANRSITMSLVRSNVFGQNTPAIAASEADYGEMWAQDIVAMEGYAGTSAAASELAPFTTPPPTTHGVAELLADTAATELGAAAPAAAIGTDVLPTLQSFLPPPFDALPNPLQDLDILVATGILVAGASLATSLAQFAEDVRDDQIDESIQRQLADRELAKDNEPGVAAPEIASKPGLSAAVTASGGRAATVGGLSVPQSWALPPAVRQVAAMFPSSTPMFVASDADGSYMGIMGAGMAATGLAGLAARGGAPSSPTPPAAASAAGGGAGAAAAKPAANTPAIPAAAADAAIPGLPPGLPPGVVANLAATLAAIPGATIIVVPPTQGQ